MKSNSLFSGALLVAILFLSTRCQKEDENPYTIYDGEPGRVGYCSVINSEGDLYIVGSRGSDILVLKTSLNGDLKWEKTYNLFGSSINSNGWTIEETYDNCFLISAYNSWDIDFNGLLKINASGDSIWSYILQNSGYVALKAVAEISDHSIIVVHEEETDIYQGLYEVTISKISQDGEFLASKVSPEIFTHEVSFNGWQADQDGQVIFSTSQYDQAGSIWTVSPGLDIISQVPFQYGKEIAYFSETPGIFICADWYTQHSQLLPLSKETPGNDPMWEQEILMPCTGWADHIWIGPVPGGYMILGALWDQVHAYYYDTYPFCMELNASGNQDWLWYDKVNINALPSNFHLVSENEYLMVGSPRINDDHIVIWRLKNGVLIN